MPAFTPVGVALTVRNFESFFVKMSKVQTSITRLSRVTSTAGPGFSRLGRAFDIFAGSLAAIIASRTFFTIRRFLEEIIELSFGAASAFQTLTIRLEGLIARQIRSADATLSQEKSFSMAAESAQRYLNWVKQLALTTPIDVDVISNTFTLAQAYGFTAAEAKELTESILQFSAGMGLTNSQAQRIIENFGQMRAAGKITGTELRDLARGSFVPIVRVLERMKDELGLTTVGIDELRKLASSGAISVDQFFDSFKRIVGEDFPEALERMNRTLPGVITRFKNFVKVVGGIELLGPAVSRFAEIASQALDQLATEPARKAARMLGEGLGIAIERIFNALNNQLVPALRNLAQAFGLNLPNVRQIIGLLSAFTRVVTEAVDRLSAFLNSTARDFARDFRRIAQDALQWGANIAINLATGLINGAANAIVAAMNFVSNLLSHWLAPGSPPMVAPNIGIWGSAAFTEYLRGFGLADFDVLKDLQGPLKSALGIFTQLGDLTQGEAGGIFANVSEQLARALTNFGETGAIPSGIFSGLAGFAGDFGAELDELLQREFALLDAVNQLTEAEEQLDNARKAQKDAGDSVRKLTAEYNALLRAGADPAILKAKLAELNAAEEGFAAAQDQVKAAEQAVDAASAQVDPLREAVKLQEELLNQLIEIARMQLEAAGAGGAGGLPGDFELPTPEFPDDFGAQLEENFEELFDRLGQMVLDRASGLFQPIIDAWNAAIAALSQAWGTFWASVVAAWENLWSRLISFLEESGLAQLWRTFWDLVKTIATDIWAFLVEQFWLTVESFRQAWEDHREKVIGIVQGLWTLVKSIFTTFLGLIIAFVQERLEFLRSTWETKSASILTQVGIWWANMRELYFFILGEIVDFVDDRLRTMARWWDEHGDSVQTIVGGFLELVGAAFDTFIAGTSTGVEVFLLAINRFWENHGEEVKKIVGFMFDGLGMSFDLGLQALGTAVDIFALAIEGKWQEIWDGIAKVFEDSYRIIIEAMDLWLASLAEKLESWKESFIEKGRELILSIDEGFFDKYEEVATNFDEWVGNLADILEAWIEPFRIAGNELMDGLQAGLDEKVQSLIDFFEAGVLRGLVEKIDSWTETFVEKGRELILSVLEGFSEKYEEIITSMDTFASDLAAKLEEWIEPFRTAGNKLMEGLKAGIEDKAQAVIDFLEGILKEAERLIRAILGVTSPSRVYMRIGEQMMEGLALGIQRSADLPIRATGVATAGTVVAAQRVSAPSVVSNNNLQIGPNTISNGMDMAFFEARVRRIVADAI
jgi:tape measure domain-containing protein